MARVSGRELRFKELTAILIFLTLGLIIAVARPPGVGTGPQAPLLTHAAAPWIFGPIQVLLLHFPVWVGAFLFPALVLAILVSFPWLVKLTGDKAGRAVFVLLCLVLTGLTVWFMGSEYWWR